MEIEVTDDIRVAAESENMIRILSEAFEKRTPIDINGKQYAVVSRSKSVFLLRRLITITPAPWSGEGLPPVGTVCEWCPNQDGWVQVEILGHDGEETWFRRAGQSISETCLRMAFFRPIRTPEQIAQEAEAAELSALEQELEHLVLTTTRLGPKELADKLIKIGYRKQVKP